MIGFLIKAGSLAVIVAMVAAIYQYIKKETVTVATVKGKIITVILFAVSLAGIYLAIVILLAPLIECVIQATEIAKTLGPAGIAIVLELIVAITIGSFWYLFSIVAKTVGLNEKWQKFGAGLFLILWAYLAIEALNISDDCAFWISHLVIIAIMGAAGYQLISKWYSDYQQMFAINIVYIADMIATAVMCGFFGWNVGANTTGSLLFLTPFLAFNLLVFTISYVLGKGEKKLRKRPAFYVLLPWTFILCLCFGYFVYLQTTNRLTRQELTSLRNFNVYSLALENLKRSFNLAGTKATKEKAQKALEENDVAALEEAVTEFKEIDDRQRHMPRTKPRLPAEIEKDIEGAKEAWRGMTGGGPPPAPGYVPPPDYKVYQPGTYTFTLKAGETLNPGVEFSPGRKGKYSVISKDNNFKLIYSDGDVVPGNADKAPAKDFPKFKIYAITDQKDIVMVVK